MQMINQTNMPIQQTQSINFNDIVLAKYGINIDDNLNFEHKWEDRYSCLCVGDLTLRSTFSVQGVGVLDYKKFYPYCDLSCQCGTCSCCSECCTCCKNCCDYHHYYRLPIYELSSNNITIATYEGNYANVYLGDQLFAEMTWPTQNVQDLVFGRCQSSYPQIAVQSGAAKFLLKPENQKCPQIQNNTILIPCAPLGFFQEQREIYAHRSKEIKAPITIKNKRGFESQARFHLLPSCYDNPNYPQFDINFNPSITQQERLLVIVGLIQMSFHDQWQNIVPQQNQQSSYNSHYNHYINFLAILTLVTAKTKPKPKSKPKSKPSASLIMNIMNSFHLKQNIIKKMHHEEQQNDEQGGLLNNFTNKITGAISSFEDKITGGREIPQNVEFTHEFTKIQTDSCALPEYQSSFSIPGLGNLTYLIEKNDTDWTQICSLTSHQYPHPKYTLKNGLITISYWRENLGRVSYKGEQIGTFLQCKPALADMFCGRWRSQYPQIKLEIKKQSFHLIPEEMMYPQCNQNYCCCCLAPCGLKHHERKFTVQGLEKLVEINTTRDLTTALDHHILCMRNHQPNFPKHSIVFGWQIPDEQRIMILAGLIHIQMFEQWNHVNNQPESKRQSII